MVRRQTSDLSSPEMAHGGSYSCMKNLKYVFFFCGIYSENFSTD